MEEVVFVSFDLLESFPIANLLSSKLPSLLSFVLCPKTAVGATSPRYSLSASGISEVIGGFEVDACWVSVGEEVGTLVRTGVFVGVGTLVGVGVFVGVGELVGVGVTVGVKVGVDTGVDELLVEPLVETAKITQFPPPSLCLPAD